MAPPRTIVKNVSTKNKTTTLKKSTKPTTEKKVPVIVVSAADRPRTSTVPKVATPKSKESVPSPGTNVTTSSKKASWKRRPKPAHSGVPVPDKMKMLFEKQLQNSDCSL